MIASVFVSHSIGPSNSCCSPPSISIFTKANLVTVNLLMIAPTLIIGTNEPFSDSFPRLESSLNSNRAIASFGPMVASKTWPLIPFTSRFWRTSAAFLGSSVLRWKETHPDVSLQESDAAENICAHRSYFEGEFGEGGVG